MFAAAHFDNLLVLLFFAIAILFQILTSAAAKSRKRRGDTERRSTSPSQRSRPLVTEEDESDQDRIRKFLEALGQPTTSKPPAPVAPRPTYQKPTVFPKREPPPIARRILSPLPPLTTEPPEFPRETQPGPSPLAPISEVEVKATAQPVEQQPARKAQDLATLLTSTTGLREAIILREIFGPPRSMQSLDLVGNV
jgi:hypothetical protein